MRSMGDLHRPRKDALQGVQVALPAFVRDFGPGPVDATVVGMVGRKILGQGFAVGTVERVDVVAARNGVLPSYPFRDGNSTEVVCQNRRPAVDNGIAVCRLVYLDGHGRR